MNSLFEKWKNVKPDVNQSIKLNILIINLPCYGFGDIVFAVKFRNFLKEWYPKFNIKIATTQPDKFKTLGYKKDLYSFNSKQTECRRLKLLKFTKPPKTRFDLIFIAPLTSDFNRDLGDVKKVLPYSTKYNTYFLSEYNDSLRKKIDFHLGVGSNRLGLFFTKPIKYTRYLKFKNYCVVYVSENIPSVKSCVLNFCEMVAKKYQEKNFSLVLPKFIEQDFGEDILDIAAKYYNKGIVYKSNGIIDKYDFDREGKVINLRYDIFPLQYKDMNSVIYHSNKDILVTGDQSFTDVVSCCVKKNIFYQIAPWKTSLANNLVKEMPNIWLKKKKTTCGSLKAINYISNYKKFKRTWDFTKIGKPLFDRLITFTQYVKKNKFVLND